MDNITVTKSFLPPIEEYTKWVQKAYDNQWLTNRGELVKILEEKLKTFLGVDWMIVTNNGTIPMQITLKILGEQGEIITTPFSYIATTSSIVWENCTPVFVDIDPEHLTIDETKIESAITDKTTAILTTHVFGNPCNVEAIEQIAKKHSLKVIYDAAHCFGVKYKGESIFNYGDVSTCSFHATKLFHTGEGGAMFSQDKNLQHQLYYHHNFGHQSSESFYGIGINGKVSELQAAMGLAVLPHIDEIIGKRREVCNYYDSHLDFSKISKLKIRQGTEWNYSYYPIIFESEEELLKVLQKMRVCNITPRRYFYPSLNTIDYLKGQSMPISEDISKRILCLPLYLGLKNTDLNKIVNCIN